LAFLAFFDLSIFLFFDLPVLFMTSLHHGGKTVLFFINSFEGGNLRIGHGSQDFKDLFLHKLRCHMLFLHAFKVCCQMLFVHAFKVCCHMLFCMYLRCVAKCCLCMHFLLFIVFSNNLQRLLLLIVQPIIV